MWLLPVPLLPVIKRSSCRWTKESAKSSSTKRRSSLGWKSQSKAAMVLRTFMPLPLMRHSMLRSRLMAAAAASSCSAASRSEGWCSLTQAR